jgi:hypothetical protein
MQSRRGVMHFRITGKCDKIRFIPVHAMALRMIGEYLETLAKHGGGQEKRDLTSVSLDLCRQDRKNGFLP